MQLSQSNLEFCSNRSNGEAKDLNEQLGGQNFGTAFLRLGKAWHRPLSRMNVDHDGSYRSKASNLLDVVCPGRIGRWSFRFLFPAHHVECVVVFELVLSRLGWHDLAFAGIGGVRLGQEEVDEEERNRTILWSNRSSVLRFRYQPKIL
jgi:hypothetical protein